MGIDERSGLNGQERSAASKLRLAFEEARNRVSITRRHRGLVQASAGPDLNSANPFARILWGSALWTEFVIQFALHEECLFPEVPLFWVTLTDVGCFTAHDAKQIAIAPFA